MTVRMVFSQSDSFAVVAHSRPSNRCARLELLVNDVLGRFGPWRYGRSDGRRAFFRVY